MVAGCPIVPGVTETAEALHRDRLSSSSFHFPCTKQGGGGGYHCQKTTRTRPPQTRNRRQIKSGGGFGLLSNIMQHFLTFDNFSFPACNLALAPLPQAVAIQSISSPPHPTSPSLSDGWARLMRCYRVHMGQIPVYHGKTLRRVRCNSMSGSEVERCAVIVGWEVGLACKSEGSPVTGLITLIRSIWSLYHSPPPWYIAQNWDNCCWMGKYKVERSNAAWPRLQTNID